MMEDQIKQMMQAMESMQTRLIMTEKALVEARAGTPPPQRMTPLVGTRSIGKAPSFSGEHKGWRDWSFQCTAYMGSANARAIDALKAASVREATIASENLNLMGEEYVEMSVLRAGNAMQVSGAYDHQECVEQQRPRRMEGLVRALRPSESRTAPSPHAAVATAEEARARRADRRGG